MRPAVYAFGDDRGPAGRLASALGVALEEIALHILPDGESLPSVVPPCPATVLLYRALHRPDPKLMPLLLACDALRRAGARRLVLVAPYMPYLRQDAVFIAGQPLSRDVLGGLLGPLFERVVTVEPHLHRTPGLQSVFSGTPVTSLSAAATLAARIGGAATIAGPDAESGPWITALAGLLGAPSLVLSKTRRGDRDVELSLPPGADVNGQRVVLVDDICSSGMTLLQATRRLRDAGAAAVDVLVIHALCESDFAAELRAAGGRTIVSTDSCPHPTNAIPLAGLLASALVEELAICP